jgi:hypothetical protein
MLIPLDALPSRAELREAIGALETLARFKVRGAADELAAARSLLARLYPRDGAADRPKRKRKAPGSAGGGKARAPRHLALCDGRMIQRGAARMIRAEDRSHTCSACGGKGNAGPSWLLCSACGGKGFRLGCAERGGFNPNLRYDGPEDNGGLSRGGNGGGGGVMMRGSDRLAAVLAGAADDRAAGAGWSRLDAAAARAGRARARLRRLAVQAVRGRKMLRRRDPRTLTAGQSTRAKAETRLARYGSELRRGNRKAAAEADRAVYYGAHDPARCAAAARRALKRLGIAL